jgi:hypothetical protein
MRSAVKFDSYATHLPSGENCKLPRLKRVSKNG